MTEDGLRTAGEDRCHPFPVSGQARSPDRKHSPANRVKATVANPVLDGFGMPAEVQELPSRNDPVLLRCELPSLPR
jgi:hypothetical protein